MTQPPHLILLRAMSATFSNERTGLAQRNLECYRGCGAVLFRPMLLYQNMEVVAALVAVSTFLTSVVDLGILIYVILTPHPSGI